jgi:hypothetical protein
MELHVFWPLRTQPPSARVAVVRIAPSTSVPPPGSVNPMAHFSRPAAMAGKCSRFCSSVP